MAHALLKSVNPATEQQIAEYPELTDPELEARLAQADDAGTHWRETSLDRRIDRVRELSALLAERREADARLMTLEMGKPITQGRAEIDKCRLLCEYYAENVEQFLRPRAVAGNAASQSFVRFDPLGAVLAVMPWNFPFWQVFRFAVPSLLAGNVGLLKHASNVTGCALAIEEIFQAAGFPPGVMTTLLVGRERISDLTADRRIAAVTLTGSEGAGRSIAKAAGENLKKCVLELGGSDPFLVLPDANLERAIEQATIARTINNGQSCIAAKRFIVHADVYDEFVSGMTTRMAALKTGDPLDDSTELGPLAREDLRTDLDSQVQRSVRDGANLATGGRFRPGPGWFYEPTLLADVTPGMAAFDEETFGPAAAVIRATDLEDAVRLAHRSSFGLGASIWTEDVELAKSLAGRLEAGCVFINDFVRSDPTLPFGGVKNSGYGRELSDFGMREFVNVKSVWVR